MSSIAIRGLLTLACTTAVALTATAPARAADDCPNAAIRAQQSATHLPDCRAWEMVSPVNKNGYDARHTVGTTRASTSGERFTYLSTGSFATEAVGSPIVPRYLASRTPAGWTTRSIDPAGTPHLLYEFFCVVCDIQDPLTFSADLSKSTVRDYGQAHVPGEQPLNVISLYRRHLDDGGYELVSKNQTGPQPPEFDSNGPKATATTDDQDRIIFESPQNLTAEASGSATKTYEWHEGVVRLVGVLPDGSPAPAGAATGGSSGDNLGDPAYGTGDALSADGTRIVFTALPRDSDGRLFLRIDGGTPSARTVWVSESEHAEPAPTPAPARFEGMSRDGRRIFFTTAEQLVDADADTDRDLYRYEVDAPPGARLTLVSLGDEAIDVAGALGVSADGSVVYFAATLHEPLYVWQEGELTKIANLFSAAGTTEFIDHNNWTRSYVALKPARVSSSGRYLLFASRARLTDDDNQSPVCVASACARFYLYDAEAPPTEAITCVSCSEMSIPLGDVEVEAPDGLIKAPDRYLPRTLVEHGDDVSVYFSTPDPLVAGDNNGRSDVYEYDTRVGRAALLTSGRADTVAYVLDVSADGRHVFVATRDRLVGWDRDEVFDVYDVSVGGGFPEPIRRAPCNGDACQSQPSGKPSLVGIGSGGVPRSGEVVAESKAKFTVRVPSARQRAALVRSGRLTLKVRVSRAGRMTMRARAKLGGRIRIVGRGSRFARRQGTIRLDLVLSPAARARLRAGYPLELHVAVRFANAPRPQTMRLRLRRGS